MEGKLPQPNGYILRVDWHEEEIYVKFHDTEFVDTYSFDDFDHRWTGKYGGVWLIELE